MKKIFTLLLLFILLYVSIHIIKNYDQIINQLIIDERINLDYSEINLDDYLKENNILPKSAPNGSNNCELIGEGIIIRIHMLMKML